MEWAKEQEGAFIHAKSLLQSTALLVHYDTHKPLVLTCDASPYGVVAASHMLCDGSEKPIGYVSQTLSPAEKGYSQALSTVFGIIKFNSYLYGRPFTIFSDHRPLMYLLGEHKAILVMASARIHSWATTLSAYQYTIRYKPGSEMCNADALPKQVTSTADPSLEECLPNNLIGLIDLMSITPLSADLVSKHTRCDPVLSWVCYLVKAGEWTGKEMGEAFQPYQIRKDELSVQDGVLLWESQIIVPPKMSQCVLDELHESHPGIVKLKSLARHYVWWPKMDAHIEQVVRALIYVNQPVHCLR